MLLIFVVPFMIFWFIATYAIKPVRYIVFVLCVLVLVIIFRKAP